MRIKGHAIGGGVDPCKLGTFGVVYELGNDSRRVWSNEFPGSGDFDCKMET